jgi:hypothetical protein
MLLIRNVHVSVGEGALFLKASLKAKIDSSIENITSVQKPVNEMSVSKTSSK